MIPDRIGAITGWRAWGLTRPRDEDGLTFSLLRYSYSFWSTPSGSPAAPKPLPAKTIGQLWSTTQATLWPYNQPIEAKCSAPATNIHIHSASQYDRKRYKANVIRGKVSDIVLSAPLEKAERQEPAHGGVIPGEGCKCGIYAANETAVALKYSKDVLGRVSLWGHVVEHEQGWRAQYAYPDELYVADEKYDEVRDDLSKHYAVPIYRMSVLIKETPAEAQKKADAVAVAPAHSGLILPPMPWARARP